MSSSKKEVIIGAVIVIFISLWLIEVGINTTEISSLHSLSLSVPLKNLISWLATIWAIFGVASGLVFIFQKDKPAIKKWSDRYTVKATIPSYFVFALIPLVMGLLLLVGLHQTTWGLGLACLSVPSTLILLVFGLRQKDQP